MDSKEALSRARAIVLAVKGGVISYERGNELVKPYLCIVNEKGKNISKKYGKRWVNLNYTTLLR